MAPATEAAKALQSNRPRPTVARPIIPAIPLPYMTKRKQYVAPAPSDEQKVSIPTVTPPVTASVIATASAPDEGDISIQSPDIVETETPRAEQQVTDKKDNDETNAEGHTAQRKSAQSS